MQTGTVLHPYGIYLYAANGKTIKTFGLAGNMRFQLGRYDLETNFVVVDDVMGFENFLLGRNFLRPYRVLVDFTDMKKPVKPVWQQANPQVSVPDSSVPVALKQQVVLQHFERMIACATVVSEHLEPWIFRSVALNASFTDVSLHNVLF